MESTADPDAQNHHHRSPLLLHPQNRGSAMKKSSSRNSGSSNIPGSPFPSDFGEAADSTPYASPATTFDVPPPPDNSKAIVAVPYSPPPRAVAQKTLDGANHKSSSGQPLPPPPRAVNRVLKEEGGHPAAARASGRWAGEDERSPVVSAIVRRSNSKDMVKRAGLGFRMSEMILCLISFSVMAADKTQGWSGDSFDRYKEYRFCLSVNVIGFAYSVFQAYDLTYHLISGKHVIRHHLRSHFDFFMDQILAYLLIAASSAAATRVVDWETNWGKDSFTEMASASIAIAFLAFVSFAFSSLISGYNMCTRDLA
ncbi:hypothetical protein BT93_K0290 [Corymbia citriodora subsp. variegata]|nr:hypothetical protein BT93_K0290 [Corymbia citriodora subsp. variegata]KAF8005963.1 hypothetical protein BT93_K0290 [Corymbia citriodora subsp. variegata]